MQLLQICRLHIHDANLPFHHLLQGLTCCQFREDILHTLVVTSWYLSYCCLSIISNHSAYPPLTFDINKKKKLEQGIFVHIAASTGYFLFFGPFSENPSRSVVFEILRPVCLAPTTIPRSKSLKSPFFPNLMLGLSFSTSSSPHLDA